MKTFEEIADSFWPRPKMGEKYRDSLGIEMEILGIMDKVVFLQYHNGLMSGWPLDQLNFLIENGNIKKI